MNHTKPANDYSDDFLIPTPDNDPFSHLEDSSDETIAWVSTRSDETTRHFDNSTYAAAYEAAYGVLSASDSLITAVKRGDYVYNFYTDGQYPRGLWRRARWSDYEVFVDSESEPEWEILLDIGKLGAEEEQSWVFHGASLLFPTYDRALVTLSPGGGDSSVTREFDLSTLSFVEDGFYRPEAKGSMTWIDRDCVLVSTDFGSGTLTNSGYPRQVRMLRRGQSFEESTLILEGQPSDIAVGASWEHTPGFEKLIAYRATDFRSTILYDVNGTTGEKRTLELPQSAGASVVRDWLIVELREEWSLGHRTFSPGSLLAIPYEAAFGEIDPSVVSVLFMPDPHTSLLSLTATVSGVFFTVLDDVQSKLFFASEPKSPGQGAAEESWTVHPVEIDLPAFNNVHVGAIDSLESDDLWLTTNGFLTPTSLFRASISPSGGGVGKRSVASQSGESSVDGANAAVQRDNSAGGSAASAKQNTIDDADASEADSPVASEAGDPIQLDLTPIRNAPTRFNSEGLEVRQRWAASDDGTRIPYFVVGTTEALDGNDPAPTWLSGYGGFEISNTPTYSGVFGRTLLEHGFVYALANIRGGGEFGPGWHQAALKENRHKAYEDFAAVARDLVDSGITTRDHLVASGGSNGGLLMGNMYTTYPEYFGGIVCSVPLLDMKRFSHLLAGASWMDEYGNPDTSDWEFLQKYSAYHNVRPGYHPPIFLATSTRDDRVHPGHARKFQALLEANGLPSYYYENIEGGHAGAADIKQSAHKIALQMAFFREVVGKEN